MNAPAPDESQPAAPIPEHALLRFLRWLLEPPVRPQTPVLRVLRWVLRAAAVVLYAEILSDTGSHDGGGGGTASVNRKKT